jgi:hypothetical protein
MTAEREVGAAAFDGKMMQPNEMAEITINDMKEGKFFITPHPVVRDAVKRKGENRDLWVKDLQKTSDRYYALENAAEK